MNKLLALNRGEIAIRIMRAATELGLRTVAVYSNEDRLSLHRFKADEAYLIGKGKGPVQAYLDIASVMEIAKHYEIDAIHPGYGFLSENPNLARACAQNGITFVGPSPEILEQLGDKTAARKIAAAANVPTIPGLNTPINRLEDAVRESASIGFPMMIKAAFGGGGRGMRIAENLNDLEQRFDEARTEAANAFGNDGLFLERLIRRAKHIEVQLLGDQQGNLLHLYERDCSVQRRHQKVVEVAPAINLDPKIRQEICDAAIRIGRQVGYYSAGTVEFLVDADSGEWFFIEVNPRVQVEHTVTEVVTGIDIVQSQIQIAMGQSLHGEVMNLPQQNEIKINGAALQCRVTTEDPQNGFVPDYGKIQNYRSPAGFGIRLDGASAYGGAVISPYYDSLLVKVTAWGRDFKQACQRMDRSLREFRVRGVKTNIPFLENVVGHPQFQHGDATTRFIDETPTLLRWAPRQDRATKLLRFVGEVIVNGNSEAAGRVIPQNLRLAAIPATTTPTMAPGTKQILELHGAKGLADWALAQKQLLLTDTTMRDAHQSLMATRVRTHDMLQIADFVAHEMPQLFSLEMWGGATFDVALRFLKEDPWDRLAELRKRVPNICFQMLFRASNAVGYTAYPDNVVAGFVEQASRQGIDIFRIFDSLNWLPNMKEPMEAVLRTNSVCQAAICYTGDILDPKRTKYPLQYYVKMAKELKQMGTHMLAIKDMAGLCKPFAAAQLVKALKEEVGLPVHFHTHDTSGINASSIVMAAAMGVDVADAALASMSGTTSQPNLNSIVAALNNTDRSTGLSVDKLNQASDYWQVVRTYYSPFDSAPKSGTAEVYLHEMPGGQYTNLLEQAEAMGLGPRWREVAQTYADVNMAMGDIVKVTPSSKVVGDLAIWLVSNNMTVQQLLAVGPNHNLTLPNSVADMIDGSLGEPEGGWPEPIVQVVLKGRKPVVGRPGERLQPVDLPTELEKLRTEYGPQINDCDLMSYLMYPKVFQDFEASQTKYSDVSVLPTPVFFYGMKPGQEITVEIESGKTLVIKLLTVGDATASGERPVVFELNGQPRETLVRDRSAKATVALREKVDSANKGQVGAPIPGAVTSILVKVGDTVAKDDQLLVMEAMKMQTTVYAPIAGKVQRITAAPGESVESRDLLIVIG
jgi:pyruvate carboxylase